MRLILPKRLVKLPDSTTPLFFLAGPIRGGGDWQRIACEMLEHRWPNCLIASPCRYTEAHPLWKYRMEGEDGHFERQLEWERFYLGIAGAASRPGCILFWLPLESATHPHPGPEPYAMDTRGELGEWRGRMMYDKHIRLVVGAEEGFLGLSQIQRNFDQALKRPFPIYTTLGETVTATFTVATKR